MGIYREARAETAGKLGGRKRRENLAGENGREKWSGKV
jgi:hypothetical protein